MWSGGGLCAWGDGMKEEGGGGLAEWAVSM